jgi:hypothetical protein
MMAIMNQTSLKGLVILVLLCLTITCTKYKSPNLTALALDIDIPTRCKLGDILSPRLRITNTSKFKTGEFEIVVTVDGADYQKQKIRNGPPPGCSDELMRPSGFKVTKRGQIVFEGSIIQEDSITKAKIKKVIIVE